MAHREYVQFCEACDDTTSHTEGRRFSRLVIACLFAAGVALIGTLPWSLSWWVPLGILLVGAIPLRRSQVRCERCWWKRHQSLRTGLGMPSEVSII